MPLIRMQAATSQGLGWVGCMPVTSLDVSRSAFIVLKWEPTVSGCPALGSGLSPR